MLFEFNVYSSLLLIFFVQALVYAGMLIYKYKRQGQSPDKWLAFLLLLAALYVFPWMTGFAGWYDNQPYRNILFYTPFQHLFLIGPVLFLYVRTLLNPAARFRSTDLWHFLPGVMYFLFSLIVFCVDQLILGKYYFLANQMDPDFDGWYQLLGLLSFLIYTVVSLIYYQRYQRLLFQWISNADSYLFRWVRHFLMAFVAVLLVRFLFMLISLFYEPPYSFTWWYFLFFAALFYYVAVAGYSNSIRGKIAFWEQGRDRKKWFISTVSSRQLSGPAEPEEFQLLIEKADTLGELEAEDWLPWKARLTVAMEQEHLFADPELSLKSLADHLSTNSSVLSRAINRGFRINFNDFVNHFRIEEFKRLVELGEHRRQTLLALAFQCGFNSKATFNRAFRRALSMSPNQYVRSRASLER